MARGKDILIVFYFCFGVCLFFWKQYLLCVVVIEFRAKSLLGQHGESRREGEVGQEVRPHLHRLVPAGQADHPTHAAVAGGRDPQAVRERRLRPCDAAQGSSSGPLPPLHQMCPHHQQQLLSFHFRAQSTAHLSLHSQQQ